MAETSKPRQPHSKNPLVAFENLLWRWLNSLPLAIAVMFALAILSALGTIIPQEHLLQGTAAMNPQQFYIDRFGAARYQLLHALGLTRIYFTWYFFVLLVWLSISAVVCNITRFRRTLAQWRRPRVERSVRGFASDPRAIVLEQAPADALLRIKADLEHERFRVRELQTAGAVCLYADRGFMKKWALVLLHFSVIVLIFGAVYGKMYGVEGWIRLYDGEQQPLVLDVKENKLRFIQPLLSRVKPLEYRLAQERFRIDYDAHIELPAAMRGLPPDAQEYSRYFVKQYVSTLTAEHGAKRKTQEVSVNHPLVLDKLVLYQSGYGQQGSLVATHGAARQEYPAPAGEWLALAPGGLISAEEALARGLPMSNLVVNLEPIKSGDLYQHGVKQGTLGPLTLAHIADTDTMREWMQLISTDKALELILEGDIYSLTLSPEVINYSEFSYKRDPGIPVLYLGWIALITGITLGLYIPFTQVWLRIEPGRVLALSTGPGGVRDRHGRYARWRDILKQP